MSELNAVYHERNMLVAYLATSYPSHLARHAEQESWEEDWRWIVCVHTPTGQMTWHIHDSEYPLFRHLAPAPSHWDGHTTEEKYTRLLGLICARTATPQKETIMTDTTPGQIAYEAFWQAFAAIYGADIDIWETTAPGTQRCWEAAAQAVRAQCTQRWTAEDIVQQINAREAASLEALRREAEEATP